MGRIPVGFGCSCRNLLVCDVWCPSKGHNSDSEKGILLDRSYDTTIPQCFNIARFLLILMGNLLKWQWWEWSLRFNMVCRLDFRSNCTLAFLQLILQNRPSSSEITCRVKDQESWKRCTSKWQCEQFRVKQVVNWTRRVWSVRRRFNWHIEEMWHCGSKAEDSCTKNQLSHLCIEHSVRDCHNFRLFISFRRRSRCWCCFPRPAAILRTDHISSLSKGCYQTDGYCKPKQQAHNNAFGLLCYLDGFVSCKWDHLVYARLPLWLREEQWPIKRGIL